MGTVIRPEITKKSQWYLDKHRYYELKHFCMQCPTWKKELLYLDGWNGQEHSALKGHELVRPSEAVAIKRAFFIERIEMLHKAAFETDPVLGDYILEGIVTGKSYEVLNAFKRVPACKDVYYELYRKYFYILSSFRM